MNKKIFLLLFVSMILLFTACNSHKESHEDHHFESELDRLFYINSDIEKEHEKIPAEIKEEIVVPDWESIPFEVEDVYLKYREKGDQNLPSVRISYTGNSNYVSVSLWGYPEEKTTFDGMHPIMLKQNIQAYHSGEGKNKMVQWANPNKNDLLQRVAITKVGENQDNGYEFTVDDAIDMANSALENDKSQ